MPRLFRALLVALAATVAAACSAGAAPGATPPSHQETSAVKPHDDPPLPSPAASAAARAPAKTELATFAGGCFWCVEAVLEQVDGVIDARSGYMGGASRNPSYREVSAGESGHAEVVQVVFDPAKVTYEALLDWFWKSHDPTTLNRQGADEGTQYRSAIFVHGPEQRAAAERSKAAAQARFEDPIVTEIADAAPFTEAEDYHQDYYRQNRAQSYCRAVIQPKLKKLGLKD